MALTAAELAVADFLGLDLADLAEAGFSSPVRALLPDLEARGVTSAAELTEWDRGRLTVGYEVGKIQCGHAAPFLHGDPMPYW